MSMTNAVEKAVELGTTRVANHVLIDANKSKLAIALANQLLAEQFRVVSLQTETRFEPVVWVHPDVRLAAAVVRDAACYYKQGYDEYGAFRIGRMKRDGAIVQWMERPDKTPWWRH